MELVIGTGAREREWATRHLRKGSNWDYKQHTGENNEWVMGYWDSRNHSHRPFLVEKISAFYPFSSILEIGCNCGPNLYLLAKKYPDIEIAGIDINPRAIEEGDELLAKEGISNVKLSVAKADELERFQDKSFDIVFTDAVLIYVGPDKIKKVVYDMVRIARQALILVERQTLELNHNDPYSLGIYYKGLWLRNYTALFKQYVPEERISISKITEKIWPDRGWQEMGAIIEVSLGKES
jgi:ubiquinone/menaquinone biosynthesis C-methylase UbiE